ncbi:MAG: glycosyltransferase family 4 protein [Candidatus Pacebacteria bacterium]|nr:glycosyltransferase family 4 protein [Candidatus Paceibacterota bacterium]
MIIGIDIRMLARGTRSGIEEYTINLLSNMLKLDNNIQFKLFYNGYKKVDLEYDFLKLSNVQLKEFKIPNRLLDFSFQYFGYPKVDKLLGGVDVFFSPHIFSSAVSKNCKTVTTFHDLSFENHREFYSASKNYWHFSMNPKKQARKSGKIIAVSNSTKEDLMKIYKINTKKIKVVYSGINSLSSIEYSKSSISEIKKKYNLPENYILYLGTIEPRKNIIGIIRAFEELKKYNTKKNYKLVIAGSRGWLCKDVFEVAKNSAVMNDIIFTGFIDDDDKSILYKLADIFVYPSFYEGFGFPPLEAMQNTTPVITSNFSSLPEAVGDAAITVNPYNIDELARAMKDLLGDENLRNNLIEKGIKQTKKFSWQKCAEETLDVLKSTR